MLTFSSIFTWVNSTIACSLEIALLFLVIRRHLYRRLLLFSVYLILLPGWDMLAGWMAHTSSFYRPVWFRVYWSGDFVFSTLLLLSIAEICRRNLRGYPTVWTFAVRLLTLVATILVSWTTYTAVHNVHHVRLLIITGEQRFECMQMILLLLILSVSTYYRMQIPPLHRLVLIGIGVYSSLEAANDQIGLLKTLPLDSFFDYARRGFFTFALAIWAYAVWRWGASTIEQPELIAQATYEDMSPQIHDQLRDLNNIVLELPRPDSR
jgi:hypothetical protein